MNQLERALTANSFAAPPAHILEGVDESLAHRNHPAAPHTLYAELWHITYGNKSRSTGSPASKPRSHRTPPPASPRPRKSPPNPGTHSRNAFPPALCKPPNTPPTSQTLAVRFAVLPPPVPTRIMTIEDQLISLAGHNAYHFGRIVLLRQLAGVWPSASGGFTW